MAAHLLSLTDGPSVQIDKPILLFGRHEECDVQLNSKKVSRRHCVLFMHEGRWVIEDGRSGRGTFLNGRPLTKARPLNFASDCAIRAATPEACGVAMLVPLRRP